MQYVLNKFFLFLCLNYNIYLYSMKYNCSLLPKYIFIINYLLLNYVLFLFFEYLLIF